MLHILVLHHWEKQLYYIYTVSTHGHYKLYSLSFSSYLDWIPQITMHFVITISLSPRLSSKSSDSFSYKRGGKNMTNCVHVEVNYK